jgi:hypothetical protein
MFDVGKPYTRKEIHAQLGGSMRACLLEARGSVVGICYEPRMNPQAPREILIGRGPQKERAGQALAAQPDAVPVFAKRRSNTWEFVGNFKGAGYIASEYEAARRADGSGRTDVAGVLLLAPA